MILAFGLYALGAALVTWPAALHLTAMIPLGSESPSTVPLFNLWTMGWNVDRLLNGYRAYWQAPIFHPVRGAFAFSDPQPLTGLLAAPLWGLNRALAYNLVLLLFLALNGWSAYGLLRRRGVSPLPAFVGGLLCQALPYLAHERGVLQLQPFFGMLWAVEGLWGLLARPRWGAALALGLGAAATFLTSEYYGLFLLILLAPLGLWGLFVWRGARSWMQVAAAGLLAAAAMLPILWPQRAILEGMGFRRSARTVERNSAEISGYARLPEEVLGGALFQPPGASGQPLFPGAGMVLLGIFGLAVGLRGEGECRWTVYLFASALLAFLLSLGLNLRPGGWAPYALLREYVPGFENLRSPFRWGMWVQLALALLAAQGLAALWRRRRGLALGLALLSLVEIAPLPARLAAVPEPLSVETMRSPAVFLPYVQGTSAAAYEQTAEWMVQTLPLEVGLVNGYSGYFPPQNTRLKELLSDFPSGESLEALRSLGVQTVVIRSDWLAGERLRRLEGRRFARELIWVGEAQGLSVYRLSQADP